MQRLPKSVKNKVVIEKYSSYLLGWYFGTFTIIAMYLLLNFISNKYIAVIVVISITLLIGLTGSILDNKINR